MNVIFFPWEIQEIVLWWGSFILVWGSAGVELAARSPGLRVQRVYKSKIVNAYFVVVLEVCALSGASRED